ncbi:MAG: hypothetical protein WB757_08390 [Candidatus Cybelea sp.]
MRRIALAAIATILALIAMASPTWIEFVTGFDLDQHDGSVERAIAAGLLTLAGLALAIRAIKWRRFTTTRP